MTTRSGGQLDSQPNRRTGSKAKMAKNLGSMQSRNMGKRAPSGSSYGQVHTVSGGPGQGGSGSARKMPKGRKK